MERHSSQSWQKPTIREYDVLLLAALDNNHNNNTRSSSSANNDLLVSASKIKEEKEDLDKSISEFHNLTKEEKILSEELKLDLDAYGCDETLNEILPHEEFQLNELSQSLTYHSKDYFDVDCYLNSNDDYDDDDDNYDTHVRRAAYPIEESFTLALENHVGNNRFYILLSRFREKYMFFLNQEGEGSQACDDMAHEIYHTICDRCYPCGKFLEYNMEDLQQPWKVLEEEEAVLRVKKAFLEPPTVKLARTFPYHLIHKKRDGVDQHTITTGLSTFVLSTSNGGEEEELHLEEDQESFLDYSVYSGYTDSYLDGSKVQSSSHQLSDCTSYASHQTDPHGLLQRTSSHSRSTSSKNRDTMDAKFRRRGVLSSFWKEDQDDVDQSNQSQGQDKHQHDVHVNLQKDIFLVNSKLVDLVEKTFNEKIGRNHETDSIMSELGYELKHVNISNQDVTSQSSKRKRTFCAKNSDKGSKINSYFDIEHVKVKTDNGEIRNLSELDVLCRADENSLPEPLDVNHIGNNRLKAVVLLNLFRHPSRYELSLSPLTFRNRTIFQIMSEITNSPKGLASFVRLDHANVWIEYDRMMACKILMSFLEKCLAQPNPSSLCQLPPIGTPVYIGKMPLVTFDTLQKESLEVIRRRFKKKTTDIIRDVEEVQSLQMKARTLQKRRAQLIS